MNKKHSLFLVIGLLILIGFNNGCGSDSGFCTQMVCSDSLIVRVLPTESYIPGNYSAELVFSDSVSIKADFEVIDVPSLSASAIPNDSYPTSWSIYDGLPNYVEIVYSGNIPSNDSFQDYEFTNDAQIQISRGGEIILSEVIVPNYNYYWCNQEAGKCDPRENKNAEIELTITD